MPAAIKKGDFDDEDADAVKGLDRIGGGRLHALTSVPPVPAKKSRKTKTPPPSLSSSGLEVRPVKQHPDSAQRRTLSVSSENARDKIAPLPTPIPLPKQQASSKDLGSASNTEKGTLLRSKSAIKQASDSPGFETPVPQAAIRGPEVILSPDPEPLGYFYKEPVHVADQLAKGAGAVYLVTSSPSDPGTIHVFLKGTRYLEYPILSMFNYISSSTKLCPQFKEADGSSVFTTSLIFTSQKKVVKFMKTVKALQSRAPSADTPGYQVSTSKEAASEPTLTRHAEQKHTEATILASNAALQSEPDAIKPTGKDEQHNLGLTCDLVDLSQSEETVAFNCNFNVGSSSAHAMDLVSLVFPLSETSPEPLLSMDTLKCPPSFENKSIVEVSSCDRARPEKVHQIYEAENQQDFSQAKSHTYPTEVPRQPLPVTLASSEHLECLESQLLEILPKFEAMSRILSSFEENKREAAVRYVLAQLKKKESAKVDFQLSSAELLLQTLVARFKHRRDTTTSSYTTSRSHPKYSFSDMTLLRKHAVQPAKELFKFDCSPEPISASQVIVSENSPISVSDHQSDTITTQKQTLSTIAKPIQVTKADPERAKSPTKSSSMSDTTNLSVVGPHAAAVAGSSPSGLKLAVSLQDITNSQAADQIPRKTTTNGLRASRWAPVNDSSKGNKGSS